MLTEHLKYEGKCIKHIKSENENRGKNSILFECAFSIYY